MLAKFCVDELKCMADKLLMERKINITVSSKQALFVAMFSFNVSFRDLTLNCRSKKFFFDFKEGELNKTLITKY